ncbi:MAG: ABC transporter permease subunit [Proteobacteria bacterium]|nr:ABC transporter permease subunit [Pseudomonadota bacterium]MBU1640348.1 ABC transporter permease subunit [Pseudomonadota bacterium]
MRKLPVFLGLHASPSTSLKWVLAVIPFILLIMVYLVASDIRHRSNPSDKLLPTVSKMYTAINKAAFEENARTGQYQLWNDTASSLKRIGIGLGAAAICGLFCGLNLGLLPGIKNLFLPFTTFISIIPPLAILPIMFILFGVDELAKIVLIFIGTFPLITRDIYLTVKKIPREQIIKSLTLGASPFSVTYLIILPQIMPRLIDTVRISMGPAWLFLIASEAIAATSGLGYRIFLVRRYLAMDTIIPYVLWIVFIGITVDWGLRKIVQTKYRWYLEY